MMYQCYYLVSHEIFAKLRHCPPPLIFFVNPLVDPLLQNQIMYILLIILTTLSSCKVYHNPINIRYLPNKVSTFY